MNHPKNIVPNFIGKTAFIMPGSFKHFRKNSRKYFHFIILMQTVTLSPIHITGSL